MLFDKLFKKPEPAVEIKNPIYPILFTLEMEPYGTNFECLRNGRKQRSAQIKKMKLGDPIVIDKGKWQSETLLLVINDKGLDVGSFPEPFYKYMTGLVDNLQIGGTVTNKEPFTINMEVRGQYRKEWEFAEVQPGPKGKEYAYNVTTNEEYMCLPTDEIPCQLVLVEDTYTIKAAGRMIGTINPRKTEKLKNMLDKHECTTTLKLVPNYYAGSVKMVLRF